MRNGREQIWPELGNRIADVTGLTNLFERSSVVLEQNPPTAVPVLRAADRPEADNQRAFSGTLFIAEMAISEET